MSFETPSSGEYTLENGLSYAEQAQIEPMAKWALGEIRSIDGWLMSFDDLVEALEEDKELGQAMVDEVLTYLEVNNWARRIMLSDGKWYMQGVPPV